MLAKWNRKLIAVSYLLKNQGSKLSWFFQILWKTIEKTQKQESRRNYFCLKMISKVAKVAFTINFPKKHPDFGDLKANQRHERHARVFFICFSTYDLNIKIGLDT